jgi:hypothetical protein
METHRAKPASFRGAAGRSAPVCCGSAALIYCLSLAGCAARDEPAVLVSDAPAVPGLPPTCETVAGSTDASWYQRESGDTWIEKGSHFSVVHSDATRDARAGVDNAGQATRDAAEATALYGAYAFAFDKLDSRDVSFPSAGLPEMIDERARAHARGESVAFPRVRIADRVVETCGRPTSDARTWRASLLVEYPIAYLRGDVNNARWNESRVSNEARVVIDSARAHLSEGTWFDALLDLARAGSLLNSVTERPSVVGLADEVDSLERRAARSLSVEALGGVEVIEVGERREIAMEFRWTYEWEGRRVPAARIPVTFLPHGFDGVFSSDVETGADGVGVCRVMVAYGEVGEHAIEPRVDEGVLTQALGSSSPGAAGSGDTLLHPVFLVEGAHALTVCVELAGFPASDEAHVLEGLERRMERDGFTLEPCSADVDVVIRADGGISSSGDDGAWTAVVALSATAFDQRTAKEIGRPSIRVEERSSEGRRGSEVLGLREAGRLLAAYLSHRIIAAGR